MPAEPGLSSRCNRFDMVHPRDSPAVMRFGLARAVIPVILSGMTNRLNLHLVSDATGETLNSIARATVVQFEHAQIVYHRWSLIRSRLKLQSVLDGIEAEPGPVLSTLVEKSLRAELETACQRLGVAVVHVLDPVLNMLAEQVGETALSRPGRQYVLDDAYFKRIDAIHYVLAHDDGQVMPGSARPMSSWLACRAVQKRRPRSIWPIAASNAPMCRWSPVSPRRRSWRTPIVR